MSHRQGLIDYNGTSVKICVPTLGNICDLWWNWTNEVVDCIPNSNGIKFMFAGPVDVLRTKICEEAIEEDIDYVLMLDDDILVPHYFLHRLLYTAKQTNADVVNCPCWVKSVYGSLTFFDFVIFSENGERVLRPYPLKEHHLVFGGYQEYDMGGCGCILIKTDLLRRMEKPLFRLGYEGVEKRGGLEFSYSVSAGEDFWFHHQAHKAEAKMILDCGVPCDHYDVDDDSIYPHEDVVKIIVPDLEPGKRFYQLDHPKAWFRNKIKEMGKKNGNY